jgi:AraC-like DNA-binding protein
LAISVRYLHRVFSDDGTTFGRVLLRHRLEAARRALEDPAFARVTITDLALRNGFADPTHFGRAFKAAYGRTPLSHRRESLRAATQCA